MTKLLLSILIIFLLSVTLVSAERTADYVIREGLINENGELSTTTNPITNFNVVGYVCLDSTCSSVGDQIFSVNSGPLDSIQLTYPTILQSQYGYGVYYYKDGFIPWEQNPGWSGTDPSDPQGPYTKYLSKKTSCTAPIDTFETINDVQPNIPIIITLDASLDATTYAAIQSSGPLDYVPPALADHYSVDTDVTLVITDANGNVVFTQTQAITIPYSGSQRVEFTWTPDEVGDYTARATTDVTDSKCLASQQQYAQKNIHVLDEVPKNICYTLLNDLATSDKFPTAGDVITISGEKISSHADELSVLTSVPTSVTYNLIHRTSGSLVDSGSLTLQANQNNFDAQAFGFDVNIPSTLTGFYDISVTAIASSSLCNGLNNLAETASQSFFVNQKPSSAPSLSNLPDITILEGSSALDNVIDLYAYTLDQDTLSTDLRYSIVTQSNPSLISCSIDNNRYIDCTSPLGYGYSQVTVQVSDTVFNDQDSFIVFVDPLGVNSAPAIITTPSTIAIQDLLYKYDADASDEENDQLVFSLVDSPNGMTINSATGLVEWTPDEDFVGDDVSVAIQVSDGSLTGLQFFILKVFEFPHKFSLSAVDFSNSEVKAGSSIDIFSRIFNSGHHKEKDLRFQVIVPELGIQSPISKFNLGVQDTKWVGFIIDIPKATKKGEYLVELLLSNDEFTDKKLFSINVI